MLASDESMYGYSQDICLKAEKASLGACTVLANRWVTIPTDRSKSILRQRNMGVSVLRCKSQRNRLCEGKLLTFLTFCK